MGARHSKPSIITLIAVMMVYLSQLHIVSILCSVPAYSMLVGGHTVVLRPDSYFCIQEVHDCIPYDELPVFYFLQVIQHKAIKYDMLPLSPLSIQRLSEYILHLALSVRFLVGDKLKKS